MPGLRDHASRWSSRVLGFFFGISLEWTDEGYIRRVRQQSTTSEDQLSRICTRMNFGARFRDVFDRGTVIDGSPESLNLGRIRLKTSQSGLAARPRYTRSCSRRVCFASSKKYGHPPARVEPTPKVMAGCGWADRQGSRRTLRKTSRVLRIAPRPPR